MSLQAPDIPGGTAMMPARANPSMTQPAESDSVQAPPVPQLIQGGMAVGVADRPFLEVPGYATIPG